MSLPGKRIALGHALTPKSLPEKKSFVNCCACSNFPLRTSLESPQMMQIFANFVAWLLKITCLRNLTSHRKVYLTLNLSQILFCYVSDTFLLRPGVHDYFFSIKKNHMVSTQRNPE